MKLLLETNEENLAKILDAEQTLWEAGIEFDAGTPIDSSPRVIREWFFDGPGKGYRVENFEDEDIQFVDGGPQVNLWNPHTDQVILDSRLKEYPEALEYVKEHELKHKKYGLNLVKQLKHEFKNDCVVYISDSEVAEQLQEYKNSREVDVKASMVMKSVNFFRSIWVPFLMAFAIFYRMLKNLSAFLKSTAGDTDY